jgi:hypothetical protein
MHGLVAGDLLEDMRGALPVDRAKHEEATVEPGGEEVAQIRVDAGERLVLARKARPTSRPGGARRRVCLQAGHPGKREARLPPERGDAT